MNTLQVLDRGDAAQVEEIDATAAIARTWPLPGSDMGESMFDCNAPT